MEYPVFSSMEQRPYKVQMHSLILNIDFQYQNYQTKITRVLFLPDMLEK